MQIRILYFASLQERLGIESETVQLPDTVTRLGELRHWLGQRTHPWDESFGDNAQGITVLAAVNQAMAKDEHALNTHDEVAFFPPVTGG